jgi:hypothetical protein
LLTGLEPRIRFHPRAIKPDLPGAQHFLQSALRQVREMPMKPAIKPDIGLSRGDGALRNGHGHP